MGTVIKDEDFTGVSKNVRPDSKRRVVLPQELIGEGVTYHIYVNASRQVVLDPQVSIPASEAWLYKNPEALASVRRGLDDVAQGKVSKVDLASL